MFLPRGQIGEQARTAGLIVTTTANYTTDIAHYFGQLRHRCSDVAQSYHPVLSRRGLSLRARAICSMWLVVLPCGAQQTITTLSQERSVDDVIAQIASNSRSSLLYSLTYCRENHTCRKLTDRRVHPRASHSACTFHQMQTLNNAAATHRLASEQANKRRQEALTSFYSLVYVCSSLGLDDA